MVRRWGEEAMEGVWLAEALVPALWGTSALARAVPHALMSWISMVYLFRVEPSTPVPVRALFFATSAAGISRLVARLPLDMAAAGP